MYTDQLHWHFRRLATAVYCAVQRHTHLCCNLLISDSAHSSLLSLTYLCCNYLISDSAHSSLVSTLLQIQLEKVQLLTTENEQLLHRLSEDEQDAETANREASVLHKQAEAAQAALEARNKEHERQLESLRVQAEDWTNQLSALRVAAAEAEAEAEEQVLQLPL